MRKSLSSDNARRYTVMMVGTIILGFGIALCVYAGFGTDPCTCMNLGISSELHISFGMWQLIINVILLIIPLILSRHLIGPGTLVNMVLIGFLIDFFNSIFVRVLPEPGAVGRFLIMVAGIFVVGFSAAMYIEPQTGVSPYDCLAFVLAERIPVLQFRWWRIIQDVTAVTIGWLCGSVVGLGTVITAFCMGPFIAAFGKVVRKWLLTPKRV